MQLPPTSSVAYRLAMRETDIDRGGRVVRLRDAGDSDGAVVMACHGTPGSRLDLCFGERLAAERGVRLVSFDRPGYGGSTPAPFGLATIAADAHAVADELGITEFAALGISGGGPAALAAATVPGGRVSRVGVVAGVGPYQRVPDAMQLFGEDDRAALAMLPGDPDGAAAAFASGFGPLAELVGASADAMSLFGDLDSLTARDREIVLDPHYGALLMETLREGLRQGTSGVGWDHVAWVGEWDIDLRALVCPVLLWYGRDDRSVPLAHGRWLSEHLPRARLIAHDGYGHFGLLEEHLGEILDALTAPGTSCCD